MVKTFSVALCVTFVIVLPCLAPPHPPQPPDLRNRIINAPRHSKLQQQFLDWALDALDKSDLLARAEKRFGADRSHAAAESFLHAAEHLEHVEKPGPKRPPPLEVRDRVERLYFRAKQCSYFNEQGRDRQGKSVCKAALDLYQSAVQEQERGNTRVADEHAKSAEELIRAMENLAQGATPPPYPPSPPRP